MFFLSFSNRNIKFVEKKFIQKIYSTCKALLIIKKIQLIDYKKFAAAALDLSKKVFVIYVVYLGAKISIHPAQEAQIALLLAKKFIILNKYLDFTYVFSKILSVKLSKRSDINKHTINLESGKKFFTA